MWLVTADGRTLVNADSVTSITVELGRSFKEPSGVGFRLRAFANGEPRGGQWRWDLAEGTEGEMLDALARLIGAMKRPPTLDRPDGYMFDTLGRPVGMSVIRLMEPAAEASALPEPTRPDPGEPETLSRREWRKQQRTNDPDGGRRGD